MYIREICKCFCISHSFCYFNFLVWWHISDSLTSFLILSLWDFIRHFFLLIPREFKTAHVSKWRLPVVQRRHNVASRVYSTFLFWQCNRTATTPKREMKDNNGKRTKRETQNQKEKKKEKKRTDCKNGVIYVYTLKHKWFLCTCWVGSMFDASLSQCMQLWNKCIWVFRCYPIYPTPPLGQGQFFKRSLTGLNSEFSFS